MVKTPKRPKNGESQAAPLTEPVIIACPYLTGMDVVFEGPIARFVGWVEIPNLGGETTERRIQLRCAMPIDAVRAIHERVADLLKRSDNL